MLPPDGPIPRSSTHVTGQWFGFVLVEFEAPSPESQVDRGNRESGYNGDFRRRDAAQ
jgi:hypothetical protein